MLPRKMVSHLFHPTGGLRWHWRALRQGSHWKPLQQSLNTWIAHWLQTLPPATNTLILIGPSAGWTLPVKSLQRFAAVVAFEPDIFARQLLRQRISRQRLKFDPHDLFSPGGWAYLNAKYSDAAILFCNVLGQITPLEAETARTWCHDLQNSLQQHHWASYHDLISTAQAPDVQAQSVKFAAGCAIENIIANFWRTNEIEICDHNTETLGFSHDFHCIPWRLRKNQWHLIQWIIHSPTIM